MSRLPILVTGGAGYIGAHTCLALAANGFEPIVYDDLTNGHRAFVRWGPFEQGDIRDAARMSEVLERYRPAAVIHFAALIEVAESVREPARYHDVNVGGAATMLDAARAAGVGRVVFSSTCATYGTPRTLPLREDHQQQPLSPYGDTKLAVERLLADADRRDELRYVALRYFNAAGAAAGEGIGESHSPETHAIPLALATAAGDRDVFSVFGQDYPTRDGTAERDYVHVLDLADAHVRALRHLLDGGDSVALNVGTGRGTTVRELLSAIERVTGRTVPSRDAPARDGDAPVLVARTDRVRETLGWAPRHGLDEMIASAWDWYRSADNPLRGRAPGA